MTAKRPVSGANINVVDEDDLSFELTYKGKVPKEEIIQNTPTAPVQQIIDINEGNYKNQLFFGDNLHLLKNLTNNPDVVGKVKLIYIDPPYAKKTKFSSRKQEHAYDDMLSGSKYLEFLRQRLILMKQLLAITPLQREGEASEIATTVEFLISDGASYITGTDILVDGGTIAGIGKVQQNQTK